MKTMQTAPVSPVTTSTTGPTAKRTTTPSGSNRPPKPRPPSAASASKASNAPYEFYAVPIDNVGHRRPLAAGSPADAAVTFTQALPGDLNLDGTVSSADLDIVRSHWGETVPAGDWTQGDPTGDGTVNSDDLNIIRANWGAATPATAAQADPQESAPTSSSSPYGPRQQSAADAALSSLANSGLHQGLSDADLAAIAEAAWLREIEGPSEQGKVEGYGAGDFEWDDIDGSRPIASSGPVCRILEC